MSDQPRLSPERRAAMGEWLQGHIARRRRRRRRLAIAGAAGAGVLTLGLAAAIVLAPQEVQDRWVECYPEADLSSPYATGVRDGAEPVGDSQAELGRFLANETTRWRDVIQKANVQPE